MLFLSLKTNSSHLFWQGVVRAIEVMTFLAGAALAAVMAAPCGARTRLGGAGRATSARL